MANNRLVLICRVCNQKEWQYFLQANIRNESIFVLGKWYPGSGWSIGNRGTDGLSEWIEKHSHGQEYPFRMDYEVPEK